MVFYFLGRVGGISPGVAGAASEHPLERVESNEVRTRGKPPPPFPKKTATFLLRSLMLLGRFPVKPGMTLRPLSSLVCSELRSDAAFFRLNYTSSIEAWYSCKLFTAPWPLRAAAMPLTVL